MDIAKTNSHGKRRNPFETENTEFFSENRCDVENEVILCECGENENDENDAAAAASWNPFENRPVSASVTRYIHFTKLNGLKLPYFRKSNVLKHPCPRPCLKFVQTSHQPNLTTIISVSRYKQH